MKRSALRLLHEHVGDMVFVLGCGAVVLTIVRPFGSTLLEGLASKRFQDIVDTVSKLASTLLALAGAALAYRRYFKGRTFAVRAKLYLSTTPVRWLKKGDSRTLLHAIDVEVENIGTVTIWDPQIVLKLRRWDSDEALNVESMTEGVESELVPGGISGIEPGEKVAHHYRVDVPEAYAAFRVSAELVSGRRHAWHRATTVANTFAPEGE